MAARTQITHFIRDVGAQTNPANVYAAATNTDGSLKVTKNGATVHAKIFWSVAQGVARTDANPSGDTVTFVDAEGVTRTADASAFLNTLK
jgi:hypothetical protein